MAAAPEPDDAHRSFRQEIALLESAGRTGAPTLDPRSIDFFGLPYDDFVFLLRDLRDEIEARAYLAIIAAVEAVLQVDFRARVNGKANVVLRDDARRLKREERQGRRIVVEDVLEAWGRLPDARGAAISEFKQLLHHRHWLAHGRYFVDRGGVPGDPEFAIARARALLAELARLDGTFPRDER